MKKKSFRVSGFSLVEIITVTILIGILARLAVPRYFILVEKGRSAEARNVLGAIREAEIAYFFEYNTYSFSFTQLQLPTLPGICNNPHYYFSYQVGPHASGFLVTATRCTAGTSKQQSIFAYFLTLDANGIMGGTSQML
ncbi:MAG: hypothetical protein V1863_06760 [Candidatus Omnitrophota bacterium]